MIAGALWQQAQIAYQRGDLARCELEGRGAIEAGGEFARRLATPWLVMALVEQGRLDEAEQLLDSAGMLGPIPPSILLTAALGSRGRLRLAQGDAAARGRGSRRRAGSQRGLVRCSASSRRGSRCWPRRSCSPTAATKRPSEAEAYAALAAGWGTPRALGHAARMRALVAPREQAIALLEEARTHFAASHARLELARCLTELGARRRAAGERRAARAILRDAHDAAHACRATALCERARAELLLAGGRPRPPAGAGADALTPAERRVAEIAADGRHQPGDRAPPLPLSQDRRDAPAQRLPQARPDRPRRARRRAALSRVQGPVQGSARRGRDVRQARLARHGTPRVRAATTPSGCAS